MCKEERLTLLTCVVGVLWCIMGDSGVQPLNESVSKEVFSINQNRAQRAFRARALKLGETFHVIGFMPRVRIVITRTHGIMPSGRRLSGAIFWRVHWLFRE